LKIPKEAAISSRKSKKGREINNTMAYGKWTNNDMQKKKYYNEN
jgi:hypothetical protein